MENKKVLGRMACMGLLVLLFFSGYYNYRQYYENQANRQAIEILQASQYATAEGLAPEVLEVQFLDMQGNDAMRDGWVTPGADGRLEIRIRYKGQCDAVEIFSTPSGTETYELQSLAARFEVAGDASLEEQEASYVWEIPQGTMAHFWLVAMNKNIGRRTEIFNIIME
ncbi:hypothetical protein [Anaerotalea alkaliphila]|uniref:Uncharacterized protein n=1 Tax=Anaerotalea alkaliphila TaxID=2662126 RepID=A0A7X5KNF9_9FIRM|nr:hypothetical protein [Anaerotalea alkaliphila]NDL67758.1 hypothetical protein [Anaerotalea alkaliphila]